MKRRTLAPGALLAGSAALVVATALWGTRLSGTKLGAPPLFAEYAPRFSAALVLPLLVAAAVVVRGPLVAQREGWHRLLALATLTTVAWGMSLALVDPAFTHGLVRGVSSPQDLLFNVSRIPAPSPFLRTFVQRIDHYTTHLQGHPPELVLALWWMRKAGLGGPVPLATLVIAAGGVTVAAVLVSVREVAGEEAARRAVPFLVLSPAAVWLVSSADALYAAAGSVGASAIVVGTLRRSDARAALGGLVLGAGLFMSYGLILAGAVPAAVAVAHRRMRSLVVAGSCTAVVGVAFAAFGFSWLAGLRATRAEYVESVAAHRPYTYFLLANLAAFAIVVGPATLAGLGRLRGPAWLLVGAGLVAVAAADLSGLSKGEVERIWLPFWPWVALAASGQNKRAQMWLGAQAATAIAVQMLLRTPW